MIRYYDSPFHVTHIKEIADKINITIDNCINIQMKNY